MTLSAKIIETGVKENVSTSGFLIHITSDTDLLAARVQGIFAILLQRQILYNLSVSLAATIDQVGVHDVVVVWL